MLVSGNRAIKQAQKKIETAQRKLESKLNTKGGKSARRHVNPMAISHGQTAEPVNESERLKVLEMVQENKISVEEAEMLLATLEGRIIIKKKVSKEAGSEKDEK